MFCTKCGQQSQDGDLFCEHCGARLRNASNAPGTAAPAQPAHTPPPVQTQPAYTPPPARPVPPRPVQPVYNQPRTSAPPKLPKSDYEKLVRQTFVDRVKSPVFLISVIFFTLSILFGFLDSMNAASTIETMLSLFSELGVSTREFRDALEGFGNVNFGLALFTSAPGILTVIGLWIVYGGASSNDGRGSVGGFTVLQVSQYISLAGAGLAFLFGFGALFGSCAMIGEAQSRYSSYSSSYYYSSSRSDALGAAQMTIFFSMLVLLGVAAFVVWYVTRILTTIANVKATAENAVADSDVSVFVGVMLFIGGGCSLLTFNLSGLTSGVAMIMFGVQLFMYRSAMAEVEAERHRYDFGPSNLSRSYGSTYTSNNTYQQPVQGQVPAWKRVQMEQSVPAPAPVPTPAQPAQEQPEQKAAEETPAAASDTQE